MKTHTPSSPQSIRGFLERRSLRGILDARRVQEADLRTAEYVGPFGSGFHSVKNPAGGTPYIVADQTGGKTVSPGSAVILGSNTGTPGESMLGGVPPGKKGGGSRSRSPRRRGTVAPSVEANQYAFGDDGVDMHAMLYADGTYASTRNTATSVGGSYSGCILSDSSLVVGDGSLILWSATALKVWDVEGSAFHSYSIPSGWVNPTAAYYQNGYLYWVEFEDIPTADIGVGDSTFDYRLRRAATDLSGVTTITTVTSANASTYGIPFTTYEDAPEPWAFGVDADGAVLYMGYTVTEIVNHEVIEWHGLQSRFALSGGAPSTQEFTADEFRTSESTTAPSSPGGFYVVTVGTTSFAIAAEYADGHTVMAKSDDASSVAADLWGVTDFDTPATAPAALSIGTGGAVVQVYGDTGLIRRGITSGTVIAATVEAFDEALNIPYALFYFGE